MDLVKYGRLLPSRVGRVGAEVYVDFKSLIGQNDFQFEHNGIYFKLVYDDWRTFSEFHNCIINGVTQEVPESFGQGRRGIPLSVFDLEGVEGAFDVGAHFGIYSVLLGCLNPDIDLWCFEPNDYNRSKLKMNLNANNIEGGRVTVSPNVVGRREGVVTFYEDRTYVGSSRDTMTPADEDGYTKTTKSCIPLSKVINNANLSSAFVKIDAEGAEFEILCDLIENTNLERISGVVEIHSDRLEEGGSEVLDYLVEQGFSYECLKDTPVTNKAYWFENPSEDQHNG